MMTSMNALEPIIIAEGSLRRRPLRAETPGMERARGRAEIAVGTGSRLARLRQSGSAKVRLPRVAAGAPLEAIFLNTAGGVTGGDRLRYEVTVAAEAAALLNTQAAERVYKSAGGFASIETRLQVSGDGRLDWLPHETILFERSALSRRLEADVDAGATLLAAEAVVLGRAARGETLHDVFFNDTWRIRRDGRLVFADAVRVDGDFAGLMAGKATGGGAAAFATIVLVAPGAEASIETARDALAETACEGGASGWNGLLLVRILAPGGQMLRAGLTRVVETLRGATMPRVWNC
jgi:urease accessory protein